jgi:shikimate dehydrogenase
MIGSGKTLLAGVMGWPVAHSRSPRVHGFWLERHGIDGAYLPLAVQPEKLQAALDGLAALGFSGCNLTIPHKVAALDLVGEVSPLAARIGAVNTVIVKKDGTLRGDNSDAFGFLENLREGAPNTIIGPDVRSSCGARGMRRIVAIERARNQTFEPQHGARRSAG